MTISSPAVLPLGNTADKAPDLNAEKPAIRTMMTIRASASRFAARVASLERSVGRELVSVEGVLVVSCVVSLIFYSVKPGP